MQLKPNEELDQSANHIRSQISANNLACEPNKELDQSANIVWKSDKCQHCFLCVPNEELDQSENLIRSQISANNVSCVPNEEFDWSANNITSVPSEDADKCAILCWSLTGAKRIA